MSVPFGRNLQCEVDISNLQAVQLSHHPVYYLFINAAKGGCIVI